MKNNLDSPGTPKALANRILEDIDEFCQRKYDDGHRSHLGASLIGHDCERHLWYIFRWIKHTKHSGQLYRLFNRGHREEDRFIEWLEGIGFQVWADDLINWKLILHAGGDYEIIPASEVKEISLSSVDASDDKTHIRRAKADGVSFPQFRISAVNGHFGGSLDGIARLPERYGIDEPVLLEFKTNGTGTGFNKLLKDGMPIAKPQHFAQTSTYGKVYNFRYVVYLNICKNNDELHVEVAKLDHNLGEYCLAKADKIINSQTVPFKLSDNPTYRQCKWCDFSSVCHKNEPSERNCRSCKFAIPVENAQWECTQFNQIIPKAEILKTALKCPNYKSIIGQV